MGVIQDLMNRVAALEKELDVKKDEVITASQVLSEIEDLEEELAEKECKTAAEVTFSKSGEKTDAKDPIEPTQESLKGLEKVENADKSTVPALNALGAKQAKAKELVARLDRLADEAEKIGEKDLAEQIDVVANTVELENGLKA